METEETLNIRAFKKLNNKHFLDGLNKAPSILHPHQASLFYKTILAHFADSTLTQEKGEAILNSISKTLSNAENVKTFVNGNFGAELPYSNTNFQDQIFSILYSIITTSPTLVDETISSKIPILIEKNPRKALTLIAIFSQKFNEIDDPWPIVDLLIQQSQYFISSDIAIDYISLLAFLNKKYTEYKSARAQHCWNQICSMLISEDLKVLRVCYGGLCAVSSGYSGGPLPLEIVILHIKQKELQNSVLAMLNTVSLSERDASHKKLLSTLLDVSSTNVRATLVLMRLCMSYEPAHVTIMIGGWMLKQLPTMNDTLRLFLVILRHKELRDQIAEGPELTGFLKNVLDIDNGSMVPVACTILRRVPLSKPLVSELSKSGFLEKFYGAPEGNNDGQTEHSKLLLTDTICRICFVKEYLSVCDMASKIIMDGGEFLEPAALVAVKLCKYQRCQKRLKEVHLDSFFRKKRNDPKLASFAKKFLHALSDSSK